MWSTTRDIARLNNTICALFSKGVGDPLCGRKENNNIVAVYRYILTGNSEGLHTSPFFHSLAAHLNALLICIAYLSVDYFSFDTTREDIMFQYLLEGKYQLLSYCQKYWIYHLDECLRLGIEQQPEAIKGIQSVLSEFLRLRAVKGTRGIFLHDNLDFSAKLLIKWKLQYISHWRSEGTEC